MKDEIKKMRFTFIALKIAILMDYAKYVFNILREWVNIRGDGVGNWFFVIALWVRIPSSGCFSKLIL